MSAKDNLAVYGEPLGAYLRAERLRVRLSQKKIAARLDVSHTYLSHLECDRRTPSLQFLQAFAGVVRRPITLTIRVP